jgi:hypothetical protein
MRLAGLTGSIAAVMALLAVAAPVRAASGTCGGDVAVTGTISGTLDPFVPGGATTTGTITINRAVGGGGAKTQDLAFYMVPAPSNPSLPVGSTVSYNGVNILNVPGTTQSSPVPGSSTIGNPPGVISTANGSPSGWLIVGFGGTGQPNTVNVTLTFTIGSLAGLPAGTFNFPFNLVYVCKGTGQYDDVTTPLTLTGNASIGVTTLSALQASVVGSALDFGELSQTTVGGTAANLPTNIRIASSGPYQVTMTSCNNYVLSYGACGVTTTPGNNTIKYNVSLLGHTAGYTGGSLTQFPNNVTCLAAGIAGLYLPISALTDEGGSGKIPSSQYQDILSVTFTPLVVSANATASTCP